ncbi:peptide deformylase [SAR202 cluster bacterium AD-804-J14_MRT_500m]|nr:peptide deformylase [SAR202 cluster bacterium AD-804-J14_MRT_500m]
MAILPLRYAPDLILRQKTRKVKEFDKKLRKLVDDMIETMHDAHGVGLAANQVGVSFRVAVIQCPEDQEALVLVNPEVMRREGVREEEEGCLSIPGYRGIAKRSIKVRVRAQDLNGKTFRVKGDNDLLAQALEHETYHLDGALYIDHLVEEGKLWKVNELDGEPEDETSSAALPSDE